MSHSSSPAVKLILPSWISTIRLGAPLRLTATALSALGETTWPRSMAPLATWRVSTATTAFMRISGFSRVNLPPAKPLGYLPSSMSQTFSPRALASITPVRMPSNQPSERYSYGSR